MSDAAFCYFGLLRAKDRVEAIVALLPEARRERLRSLLGEAAALSPAELSDRLQKLRDAEAAPLTDLPGWDRAAPQVRLWLSRRLGEEHGREDH